MGKSLHRELYAKAEFILESEDHNQQDRWGAKIPSARVYGLRMGEYALLYLHIEVDDPTFHPESGDEIFEFEGILKLDQVISKAEWLHDAYYEGTSIEHYISDGKELKDQTEQACKILDEHYKPTEGLISTPPSSVLKNILTKTDCESGREWAWKDDILYLTQSVLKRVGMTSSVNVFDKSLESIFKLLGLNTEKLKLRFFDPDKPLLENIAAIKKQNKIDEIEEKIRKKEERLRKTKAKVTRYEEAIMDLHDELRAITVGLNH